MALSLNNKAVPFPKYAVSDLSFPNIHALLMACNKIKIAEYLKLAYECLMRGEDISVDTIVTICENHLVPAILKTANLLLIKPLCIADMKKDSAQSSRC